MFSENHLSVNNYQINNERRFYRLDTGAEIIPGTNGHGPRGAGGSPLNPSERLEIKRAEKICYQKY